MPPSQPVEPGRADGPVGAGGALAFGPGGVDAPHASNVLLQRALAAGHMNAWDWDLVTDTVVCSANAYEFWGRRIGTATDFLEVIHPEDVAVVEAAGRAAVAGEAPYAIEYRLCSPGGQRRVQSRGHVEYAADGRPLRMLGVTIDISELRHAEEASRVLAEAGETLGSSLDYTATLRALAHVVVPRLADWYAVDLVTDSGELERVSVSHPDPAQVELARELHRCYPPRRDAGYGTWQVIRSGQPEWRERLTDEQLARIADDADHAGLLQRLSLRSYVCVPLVARGVSIGALTLVYAESGRTYRESDVRLAQDIARRAATAVDNARLYQALQAEQRRKDEFLATLAHELRNPLAPLRTGLALLEGAPDPATVERTHRMMERQLAHMVRLIDDLLDLSRVTRDALELQIACVELAGAIDSAVDASRPLLEAAGVELVLDLPKPRLMADIDDARIAQVLTNLLNNAAKFTPRGGRVVLSAREDGDDVLVEVADTGIGIAPDQLERVFEMFSRSRDAANHSGLGIGLTLARRLVELHDGSLTAASDGPGRGSRFLMRLPACGPATAVARRGGPSPSASDAGAGVVAAPPAGEPDAGRPLRILVVDDNVDAAESLSMLLALHGHEVRTAGDAPGALALVDGFVPDIAFLDIGLPGMSGHELATRLRADPRLGAAVLVALTGWGRDEDVQRSREAGFDHHLTKPVDVDAVLALVAERAAR